MKALGRITCPPWIAEIRLQVMESPGRDVGCMVWQQALESQGVGPHGTGPICFAMLRSRSPATLNVQAVRLASRAPSGLVWLACDPDQIGGRRRRGGRSRDRPAPTIWWLL